MEIERRKERAAESVTHGTEAVRSGSQGREDETAASREVHVPAFQPAGCPFGGLLPSEMRGEREKEEKHL